jgi:hypothetical protein
MENLFIEKSTPHLISIFPFPTMVLLATSSLPLLRLFQTMTLSTISAYDHANKAGFQPYCLFYNWKIVC